MYKNRIYFLHGETASIIEMPIKVAFSHTGPEPSSCPRTPVQAANVATTDTTAKISLQAVQFW